MLTVRTLFALATLGTPGLAAQDAGQIRIAGTVTDFGGRTIGGAEVQVVNNQFQPVARTTTGSQGEYELRVPAGRYMALIAVKDYRVRYLEYWSWNLQATSDLAIDPRIGGLEVYALNAFRPQGGYPALMVYFRPMSLRRFKADSARSASGKRLIDIAPQLVAEDVSVVLDGAALDVLALSRVTEAAGPTQSMVAYLVHVALPKAWPQGATGRLRLTVSDRETGEQGEATLFVEPHL